MSNPLRLQRRRTRGFTLPPDTICCTRPGRWGNPVRMDSWQGAFQSVLMWGCRGDKRGRSEAAVKAFRLMLSAEMTPVQMDTRDPWQREVFTLRVSAVRIPTVDEIHRELAGHNLACWCRLCPEHAAGRPLNVRCETCAPCHVDVLAEVLGYLGGADA